MESKNILDNLDTFKDLSQREKDILSIVLIPKHLRKGEVLFRQGDPAPNFYIVGTGVLLSFKTFAKTGAKEPLRQFFRGDLVGIMSMFSDNTKRSHTVKSVEDTVLLECSRDHFKRLYESNSLFSYKIIDAFVTSLSKNLREVNKTMVAIFSNPKETLLKLNDSLVSIGKQLF